MYLSKGFLQFVDPNYIFLVLTAITSNTKC